MLRVVAVAIGLLSLSPSSAAADDGEVSGEWVMATVHRHCAMCHSENPSHTTLLGQPAPKGVVLESTEDIRRFAPRIIEMVVRTRIMPFGNETAMTEAERLKLAQWLAAQ
jgi:uncharacterized membrane protein